MSDESMDTDDKYEGPARPLLIKENYSPTTKTLPNVSAFNTTSTSTTIQWKSVLTSENTCYEIKYKSEEDKLYEIKQTNENEIILTNLLPNTRYNVMVFVQNEDANSINLFSVSVKTNEQPAHQLFGKSEKLTNNSETSLDKYKIKPTRTITISKDVTRVVLADEKTQPDQIEWETYQGKTILLVGGTGSGKSTMIDSFVNYLAEVRFADNYRFKLTRETQSEEDKKDNQTKSQTETTTCYTLLKGSGLTVKHDLNIIDTPGFNDTEDKNCDKKIIKQVKELLKEHISVLNAICIVIPLNSFRMTQVQKKMLEDITRLFAKDVSDIIYCLATFNDGGEHYVIKALQEANIKIEDSFVFCNAIFSSNKSDKDSHEAGSAKWSSNSDQFDKFLQKVYKSDGKSVTLTKEVLDFIENIEIQLEGFQKRVSKATQSVINVKKEFKILERHKRVTLNKNFAYTIDVPTNVMKRVSNNEKALNCSTCKQTCHQNCWAFLEVVYWTCNAFTNFKCTVCPHKCPAADHVWESAIYEIDFERIEKNLADIVLQYQGLNEAKISVEEELVSLYKIIACINKCLEQLNEKTLSPVKYTIKKYIDNLIKLELEKKILGFEKRTEFYTLIEENIQHSNPVDKLMFHFFYKNDL